VPLNHLLHIVWRLHTAKDGAAPPPTSTRDRPKSDSPSSSLAPRRRPLAPKSAYWHNRRGVRRGRRAARQEPERDLPPDGPARRSRSDRRERRRRHPGARSQGAVLLPAPVARSSPAPAGAHGGRESPFTPGRLPPALSGHSVRSCRKPCRATIHVPKSANRPSQTPDGIVVLFVALLVDTKSGP
jgi:hypothetical protein